MSKKSSLKLFRILYFFIFPVSLYFCLWSIQIFWNKKSGNPISISVIDNLPIIDLIEKTDNFNEVWDYENQQFIPAGSYYGFCVQLVRQKCLRMTISDNILKEIIIIPNQYYSIGEMVETIGPPDNIYVLYSYPETTVYCTVMLFWENRDTLMIHDFGPDHRYEYYFEFPGNDLCKTIMDNNYKIPRTLSVDSIHFKINEFSRYEKDIIEWNGFLEE